ncbi:MAG: hypothetical protein ACLQMH_04725 [Solirubrobacteraceae bacterium]
MSIVIVHAFRRIADEGLVVQDGVLARPPRGEHTFGETLGAHRIANLAHLVSVRADQPRVHARRRHEPVRLLPGAFAAGKA